MTLGPCSNLITTQQMPWLNFEPYNLTLAKTSMNLSPSLKWLLHELNLISLMTFKQQLYFLKKPSPLIDSMNPWGQKHTRNLEAGTRKQLSRSRTRGRSRRCLGGQPKIKISTITLYESLTSKLAGIQMPWTLMSLPPIRKQS